MATSTPVPCSGKRIRYAWATVCIHVPETEMTWPVK